MISDRFKCIFIHIPKNAGTSIESKICSEEGSVNFLPDHRTVLDLEPLTLEKILKLRQKDQRYSAARRTKYFFNKKNLGSFYKTTSSLRYKTYFKFTVIRNPWSRVYSWYRAVIRNNDVRKSYKLPENLDFKEFVKYHLDYHLGLREQFYWLFDSGKNIPMDFIARFENLQKDFLKIAEAIGLANGELPKKRFTGKSASYIEVYNNETKDIIWKRYKKEISYFGYEFDQ
jgi:hypothetical protein